MKLEETLDILHSKVTGNTWLQLFTVFNRLILATGFIPPSIKKIMGQPFTSLPDSNPVGHYFNALIATGFYYEFIGWSQLIAAILLLFPRTAHLGALLFLPIIVNIAVLTTSVGFQGTWIITILMSLSATYLVCWDYDRLKPIIFAKRNSIPQFLKKEFLRVPLVFAVFGAISVCFFGYFGVGNIQKNFLMALIVTSGAGFLFGLIVAFHHRFMKIGNLESSTEGASYNKVTDVSIRS